MRALVLSLTIHVGLLALVLVLRSHDSREGTPPVRTQPSSRTEMAPVLIALIDTPSDAGAHAGGAPAAGSPTTTRSRPPSAARRASDGWERVTVTYTDSDGAAGDSDLGAGLGTGTGTGIGTGAGGLGRGDDHLRWQDMPEPPPPPPPPPVSKARPATLIYPSRDREVEDEGDLFVAKVTVDHRGDVVGAVMIKTRPGASGDHAANAIWSFRYLPALDDAGEPIRSQLEQPFQIR